LVYRIAAYVGRRAVFNFYDRKLKRASERKEAAERRQAMSNERRATSGATVER
jgi:hypothetical protein